MATQNATIKGIYLDEDPYDGGNDYTATIHATFPAYTSGDTAQIGGFATAQLWGAASDTLATLIQKCRRDGKTVTLRNGMRGQPGYDGTNRAFFGGTVTVSGGNITASLTDVAGSDQTWSSGVSTIPVRVKVAYSAV